MTAGELENRVANGEDVRTEFKLQAIQADDLAAALVAFANSQGGELIIGVSNERQIVGVTDSDNLCQYVENVAFNSCRPPIPVRIEAVPYKERLVLSVHLAG